jgi:hypothetical protein
MDDVRQRVCHEMLERDYKKEGEARATGSDLNFFKVVIPEHLAWMHDAEFTPLEQKAASIGWIAACQALQPKWWQVKQG